MKMHIINMVALSGLLLTAVNSTAMQPFALTPENLTVAFQNPHVLEAINTALKLRTLPPETISGNLGSCCKELVSGGQGIGLGFSRLLRDTAQNFGALGQSAANHYWLLGALTAGSIITWWWILPKIKFRVEFSSDNPPVYRR